MPELFTSINQKKDVLTRINAKDGAEMLRIPAGEFIMGDVQIPGNPRQKVTLSAYWIYKDLVTVGMYQQFCYETGRSMPAEPRYKGSSFNPNWSRLDHPIVKVSWKDAMAYCQWAGVTLPTEAQWEKAARGKYGYKYPWGNAWDPSKAWSKALGTTAVGQYGISPYGCTDMAGNVWQWCLDSYDTNFWNSPAAATVDPVNLGVGTPLSHVSRGGCWRSNEEVSFRGACRLESKSTTRSIYDGFRGACGA